MKEYVSRIEEACGEGRDFIIILRHATREEAIKRIRGKCRVEHTLSGVMTRGKYKGKDVSVFVTGKIVMKGLEGRKEAEALLEELLS